MIGACEFSPAGVVADGDSTDGGRSNDGASAPTVVSSSPLDGALDVPLDRLVSATFSEPMDPATLTAITFTLTSAGAAVPGTVSYADSTAVFSPDVDLESDGGFTATITTGANSDSGVALAAEYVWTFTGDAVTGGGPPVDLGTAGNYVILAKASISGTTATVTGDIGVSPAAATLITGFSLSLDPSTTFSTSTQVTGRVYAADYTEPTQARLTQAVLDMESAGTAAAAREPDPAFIELSDGDIGGMSLLPGVYRWSSGVVIPTSVILHGSATAVWIFQIAQDLTMSTGTSIVLSGGARAENVFWQITGGPVTIGTRAHFEGVVLSRTAVTVQAGATFNGRLLSQTAITIDGSTVVGPSRGPADDPDTVAIDDDLRVEASP